MPLMKADSAATFLIDRRIKQTLTQRLPSELRPDTTENALAIQKSLMGKLDDKVGGWKCSLPSGDQVIIAPIFARTIHSQSPCSVKLDDNICRIEPEIAFRFKTNLPPRDSEYTEAEIIAALAGAHLALELIHNRYLGTEQVSYLENLADCLFNQGIYLGPEIPLEKAVASPEIDFVLTQDNVKSFKGKHPNNGPILPVLWLANFLRQQGIGIKAGQVVITGSYAGMHEFKPNTEFTIEYIGLGSMNVLLQLASRSLTP